MNTCTLVITYTRMYAIVGASLLAVDSRRLMVAGCWLTAVSQQEYLRMQTKQEKVQIDKHK